MAVKEERPRKYAKPLSLHPLAPEQALSALLKVKPEPKKTSKDKARYVADIGTETQE